MLHFSKKLQVVQNRTFFHPLHFCKIYVCVQALLKSYYLLQHFLLHSIGGGAESGCCSVSYYTDSIQSISFYHSLFVKGIIVLLPSIMSKLYFGKFRSTIGRIKVQRKLQPADIKQFLQIDDFEANKTKGNCQIFRKNEEFPSTIVQ